MVKDGDIDTTAVTSGVTLFQLDGKGGLNGTANANYNLYITGWDNSGTVNCSNSLSNTSFNLSTIDTDKAFAGTKSFDIDTPVSITCTSNSSNILSSTNSINGDLKLSGTANSSNSKLFSTNKENLGLEANYNNSTLTPGSSSDSISIPISSGSGNKTLSFTIQPRLLSLELDNPAWLFSDTENNITSDINFSFTPTSVN